MMGRAKLPNTLRVKGVEKDEDVHIHSAADSLIPRDTTYISR